MNDDKEKNVRFLHATKNRFSHSFFIVFSGLFSRLVPPYLFPIQCINACIKQDLLVLLVVSTY